MGGPCETLQDGLAHAGRYGRLDRALGDYGVNLDPRSLRLIRAHVGRLRGLGRGQLVPSRTEGAEVATLVAVEGVLAVQEGGSASLEGNEPGGLEEGGDVGTVALAGEGVFRPSRPQELGVPVGDGVGVVAGWLFLVLAPIRGRPSLRGLKS